MSSRAEASGSIDLGKRDAFELSTSAHGPTPPSATNSTIQSLDYLHFVQFLGVRRIPIIPYQEISPAQPHEALLGDGSFARVHTAQWKGNLVAIKGAKHQASRFGRVNGHDNGLQWLRSLLFELQIMSHEPLCNHPNVSRIRGLSFIEADANNLQPVLVVEPALPEYPDLMRFVLAQHEMEVLERAPSLISNIADGLSALHVYGVLHGDIKPENILIYTTPSGNGILAKICDFGFSGSTVTGDPPTGITPMWSSPEMRKAAFMGTSHLLKYDFSHDIYSFGLVCIFILLQRRPSLEHEESRSPHHFTLQVQQSIDSKPDNETLFSDIRILLPCLDTCLAFDPASRPQTLKEVRSVLSSMNDGDLADNHWDIALTSFRRDITHHVEESVMVDFSPQNAAFMHHIWPKLPALLRHNLTLQLQTSLNQEGSAIMGTTKNRLIAAYRILRQIDPELPAIEGTDSGNTGSDSDDFQAILESSFAGFRKLFNADDAHKERLEPSEDVWIDKFSWKGVRQHDIHDLESISAGMFLPLSSDSLDKMKQFRSTNGFGVVSIAARMGLDDLLIALLSDGAPTDLPSPNGCTALHEAVIYDRVGCAESLIKYGADMEARLVMSPSKDQTCLTFAATAQREEMTSLLLSHGANVWHRILDNLQNTALHVSAHRGGSLAVLLNHDSRLALAQNSHGRTALHYSASSGSFSNMVRLCEAGADPCLPDMNGSTPLHAAWMGLLDVISVRNAYLWTQNPSRSESIMASLNALAKTEGEHRPLECISYLESCGASPGAKDREGYTPSVSAYHSLLTILGLPNGQLLESQRIGWKHAKFDPWTSARVLRPSDVSVKVAFPSFRSKAWFLDFHPVCVGWGYHLETYLAKLEHFEHDDVRVHLSVRAWKHTLPPRASIIGTIFCTPSPEEVLLEKKISLSDLMPEPKVLYGFSMGLVQIASPCDLLVELDVFSRYPNVDLAIVLGALQFRLEPHFEESFPDAPVHSFDPSIRVIMRMDVVPEIFEAASKPFWSSPLTYILGRHPFTSHVPLSIPWNQNPPMHTIRRALNLNSHFLALNQGNLFLLILLPVSLSMTILPQTKSWIFWLGLASSLRIVWRNERHCQFEAFPRKPSTLRRRREDAYKAEELRAPTWLLRCQRKLLIPAYCYFSSRWGAVVILLLHVHFVWMQRKHIAKLRSHYVLGPLGLDLEIFWAVLVTQIVKAIAGRL